MTTFPLRCAFAFAAAVAAVQADPYHTLSNPTAAELQQTFATPPAEYSSQVTWGWAGVMSREVIARDLDHLRSMNIHQAWVEPGRNPEAPYLSSAYFENVKIAVEEAKKRGMHLWFDDDGGYPSGFAGGKFTTDRPDLRMKALAAPEQHAIEPGQTYSQPWDETTICAVATNQDTEATQVLEPKDGKITWTAPVGGHWTVSLAKWVFRSGPTRSSNNKSGAKDTEHSLMDYLSPEANRLFIAWTFEHYKQAVGDEFGKTFLGFRGDEAAFGFNPWTPDLPAEFQKRKGYDIRPYLPAVAAIQIGRRLRSDDPAPAVTLDAAHRVFADYCDVWSDLFGENFFSADARWCAANGITLQHHIEHEEILPQLAIANGDYFKCMRDVQVPGVDVIWHQMWHDVVADFPKLASSAAHLSGHPQAMSESFAAMGGNYPTPNFDEVGWILNHQIALGITHFEYMFMPASARPGGGFPPGGQRGLRPTPAATQIRGAAPAGYRYLNDPKFPELALYVNRVTHVLAEGRPAAQVGVYIPSSSFWFGDTAANESFVSLVHALLIHQRDLDYVDDFSIASGLELRGSELVNKSGQAYRAIIVPPAVAISKAALDRLQAFAKAGGKVIFVGGGPQLVVGRNFLTAQQPADLGWAMHADAPELTSKILAALPTLDVDLPQSAPGLSYNHRQLQDADVYFLFNQGDAPINATLRLATHIRASQAENWDAHNGVVTPMTEANFGDDHASIPVKLGSWETMLVVLRR